MRASKSDEEQQGCVTRGIWQRDLLGRPSRGSGSPTRHAVRSRTHLAHLAPRAVGRPQRRTGCCPSGSAYGRPPTTLAALADLPSAQLTSIVPIKISRITQLVTKVLLARYLRLAPEARPGAAERQHRPMAAVVPAGQRHAAQRRHRPGHQPERYRRAAARHRVGQHVGWLGLHLDRLRPPAR